MNEYCRSCGRWIQSPNERCDDCYLRDQVR